MQNPALYQASGQFKIQTLYNDVVMDRNEIFGQQFFAQPPGTLASGSVVIDTNSKIREGSTLKFTFRTAADYAAGNSIRFTFPEGFTSSRAMCDVLLLVGAAPQSIVLHNSRIVTCKSVAKTLLTPDTQVVRIVNMVNPGYSGTFNGFKIEIMDSDSSIVLEKIEFNGGIVITTGDLLASVIQDDKFRISNTKYAFFINLINPVDQHGKLFINFTNEWTFNTNNCTIITGVNQKSEFDLPQCYL